MGDLLVVREKNAAADPRDARHKKGMAARNTKALWIQSV